MDILVKCIRKSDRQNPYEGIAEVGCVDSGKQLRLTVAQAVKMIEDDGRVFRVSTYDGPRVVVAQRNGRKYIKSERDGDEENNLLALGECG